MVVRARPAADQSYAQFRFHTRTIFHLQHSSPQRRNWVAPSVVLKNDVTIDERRDSPG